MPHFKEILVGLELMPKGKALTQGSSKALSQAIWLAQTSGGSLRLVHSVWSDSYYEPVAKSMSVVHEGLSEKGHNVLEAALSEAKDAGVRTELEIVEERSWIALIRAVQAGRGDSVVVGKRNKEGSDKKLGSTAMKLLRKCPAPVWVVKPEHDLVHKLVLSATDLSPVGDRAVEFGAFVAGRRDDCEMHVVHAYQVPLELQMRSANMSEEEYAAEVERMRSNAHDEIDTVLAKTDLDREAQIHIGRNNPSAAIREAVEHLHPDLLVMGTISRAGVAGMIVGNTAERLLDRVDCSMLAVKPDDFESPVR